MLKQHFGMLVALAAVAVSETSSANEITLYRSSSFSLGDKFMQLNEQRDKDANGKYQAWGVRVPSSGSGAVQIGTFANTVDRFVPGQTYEALANSSGSTEQSARATTEDYPGTLDGEFSSDGWLSRDIGTATDSARAVAVQSDGKIVVVGVGSDFHVARYDSSGNVDTGFGTSGITTINLGTLGDESFGVALQSDGKIIVCGKTSSDFGVVRLTTSGAVDTTYGTSGITKVDFGTGADVGYACAVQSDGKVVVVGKTNSDFAVARLTTSGALDTTFDTDGKVTTDFGTGADEAHFLAIQSDGKIIAVGKNNSDYAIARYTTAGALDTTFDTDGKVTTDFGSGGDSAWCVGIQSSGKIVVGGFYGTPTFNADMTLARYTTAGALDTTFGSSGTGKVQTNLGTTDDRINGCVIDGDDKIVAVGNVLNDLTVVRYTDAGALDTSFGTLGTGVLDIGSDFDLLNAVALQSDDKIVAVGRGSGNWQVFRFIP